MEEVRKEDLADLPAAQVRVIGDVREVPREALSAKDHPFVLSDYGTELGEPLEIAPQVIERGHEAQQPFLGRVLGEPCDAFKGRAFEGRSHLNDRHG